MTTHTLRTQPHQQHDSWTPLNSFANRLRLIRWDLRLGLREIAEACGVSHQTVQNWERGVQPTDLAAVADALSAAFGIDREWIFLGGGTHILDAD